MTLFVQKEVFPKKKTGYKFVEFRCKYLMTLEKFIFKNFFFTFSNRKTNFVICYLLTFLFSMFLFRFFFFQNVQCTVYSVIYPLSNIGYLLYVHSK